MYVKALKPAVSLIQGILTGIYIVKINFKSQHARVCNQLLFKEQKDEKGKREWHK
jgi:hypothetical protein